MANAIWSHFESCPILMCYFHVKYNVRKLKSMIPVKGHTSSCWNPYWQDGTNKIWYGQFCCIFSQAVGRKNIYIKSNIFFIKKYFTFSIFGVKISYFSAILSVLAPRYLFFLAKTGFGTPKKTNSWSLIRNLILVRNFFLNRLFLALCRYYCQYFWIAIMNKKWLSYKKEKNRN
jgi:hypothetical protein